METEKPVVNFVKSLSLMTLDVTLPGVVKLTQRIEGFPREYRFPIRLWRVRLGHLAHASWCLQALTEQNYPIAAINAGAILLGVVSIWSGNVDNLGRMYLPFYKRHSR